MNTFVGFFFVYLVTVLVYCNEAKASDSKAIVLSLKPGEEDGQCSLTPDQFKACSVVFLGQLNLQLPTTTDQFLQALLAFVGRGGVGHGVSDLCTYVGTFKTCAPTSCWTAANFHLFGVGTDDYLFADGFIGFDNFCTGPGLDRNFFVVNCVQGINFNDIQNIKCPDLATAITCAINVIATECPRDLVLDLCNSLVVAGDLILPQCKAPLDGACTASTAPPTPPPTLPPPPTTTPPTGCADRWHAAATGNKCYLVVLDMKNWFDAEAYCKSIASDGHITSITSAFENSNINAIAVDVPQLWIGAADFDDDDKFSWSDGKPFAYAHWDEGQPNIGNGNECVITKAATTGRWKTERCGDGNSFVCESYQQRAPTF